MLPGFAAATRTANELNVAIYTISPDAEHVAADDGSNAGDPSVAASERLKTLAAETGGRTYWGSATAAAGYRQALAEYRMDLAEGAGAVEEDKIVHDFLNTRCLTIAGGTEQILLTLAAERLLGLPR